MPPKRVKETQKGPGQPDVDPAAYGDRAEELGAIGDLRDLPREVREQALRVGVDAAEGCREGSFFQIDHSVLLAEAYRSGLEVLDIREAFDRYDGLPDLWWKALSPDADRYTAMPTSRFHPTWRLGSAANLLTRAGGCRTR